VAGLVEIRVTEDLLSRARCGEEAARAELYGLFAAATFGLIRRLLGGARALAEDAFQETMLTFFEQLATFRGEAPLGAWLRRIAVSKCLMCLRSPWQRARLDFGALAEEGAGVLLPLLVTPGPLPESLDLERALARLSPTARAVVWLYEVEGYSHEEIARAFDRSVSFSKSQLSRAHQRLREWLEPASERQTCTPN
jgi:RNA polymerase sigma-70 factor (ECF subfamily)